MDVCSRNPNRTAPVSEGGVRRTDLPLCSRTNGWSWPPHPFQLLAWLLYLYFAVTGFGVFVPLLPPHWIPAGYICTGIMFACHLVVHLLAVSIDPADSNVRAKSYKAPVPIFDRTKHAHVIENCHCYLCQVDVGPKSKHCSACNKCVASFDHHCRWLNNCVGSRNYKMFLNSVISALVGISLVLLISSYVFIQYFLDPTQLRSDKHFLVRNETGVWFVFLPVAPVTTAGAAIPALAAVTVALGLLSAALLGHLLCFHIYLMWNRLSTYEYIVRQRHRQEHRGIKGTSDTRLPTLNLLKKASYSGSLGYTNPEMEVENTNTVALAAQGAPDFYGNGRVRSVSNHVGEEELQATVSTDHGLSHTHNTQRQKKKRKVHKVPAEVNIVDEIPMETTADLRQHRTIEHRTQKNPTTIESGNLPPVSVPPPSQRLPFPAFPLRASLPPLPAGPPADYHSSSAESLEEIPVVLARLGSSSSAVSSVHARDHQRAPPRPACAPVAPPSPFPRTKRKPTSSSVRSKGRLSSQPPSVFVSRSSGQPLRLRDQTLSLGPHHTDMVETHIETVRTY